MGPVGIGPGKDPSAELAKFAVVGPQLAKGRSTPGIPSSHSIAPKSETLRVLYERGATLAALGDVTAALTNFRIAAGLYPAEAVIWRKLAALSDATSEIKSATDMFERLPASDADLPWSPAAKQFSRVKTEQAISKLEIKYRNTAPDMKEVLLREHLHAHPEDVAALRVIADLWFAQGRYPDAETLLGRILELAPAYSDARFMLAVTMFRQGNAAQAIGHARRAVEADPQSVPARTLLASCLAVSGDHARAILLYENILADAPKLPAVWLSYGHALKSDGRRDEALGAYRTCIRLAPNLGEAYWSLANFKTERFSAAEVAGMRAALQTGLLSAEDRFHLHYALGRALEQDRDFEGSFRHYAEGARIRKGEAPYSADATTAAVRRAKDIYSGPFLQSRAQSGCMDDAPIFILGMPRAGSTLIEQILSSHSQVEGTTELPEIIAMAREFGADEGKAYPASVAQLDAARLAALGERYIRDTRAYRKTGRPFFIDKMPGNWEHVGLIRMILPNAKIIDARRGAMANCFAAFKQLFAGLNYSYDLNDLGRYYRDYLAMMAHWDEVQPGAIHRVIYEDLVANTEGEVHRLLEYCRLDFEPGCLRFWETSRGVGTASSEQVRQPIFREGLDQWRNYEPWLEPLKKALDG